jgi:4-azaleucine resistance transporter AzlC
VTQLSTPPSLTDQEARRLLVLDVVGIAASVAAFGVAYGLAARDAGLSPVEAMSMSLLPFAGASQFAALGYLDQGMSWAVIVGFTALLNARHLLYGASLRPQLAGVPARQRAAMAQVLTDEAFALSTTHFARAGRTDVAGYWIAAGLGAYVPWNLGTAVGAFAGDVMPDPSRLGLDVIFPASMAGLAVALVTGRRDLTAAAVACAVSVTLALVAGPGLGIVAGGLIGPAVALVLPARARSAAPVTSPSEPERDSGGATA